MAKPRLQSKTLRLPVEEDTSPLEIMQDASLNGVAEYYYRKLIESNKGRELLSELGIHNLEVMNRLHAGYSDGSLLDVIGEQQKEAFRLKGLITEDDRDYFEGCVVFPVHDEHDALVDIYGYNRNHVELHLPGGTGVFHRNASKVYKEIIVPSSILEVARLLSKGLENVQWGDCLSHWKEDRVKSIVLIGTEDQKDKIAAEGFSVKVLPSDVLSLSKDEIQKRIHEAEPSVLSDPTNTLSIRKDGLYYAAVNEDIEYRISGVKTMFAGSLKVAIKASCNNTAPYVDTIELYSARARNTFSANLSRVSGIESARIEKDILSILEYFEAERDKELGASEVRKELSTQEQELGLSLLKDPNLFDRIIQDMEVLGYVGEDINKTLLYLAASSRILDDPLSVLILSQSAAGKSYLVDTVKRLIPSEDVIAVTSLSDQALNYVEDLMHKFLILGEAVHSDTVEHQIREMLSGKELSRLVTSTDDKGGMRSQVMRRPVIVSAVMSGTDYGINPENASRCFVISADESREQTRRIHRAQRQKYTLERFSQKEKTIPEIIAIHHAAQKMLKKVRVVNPFASHLDFPDMLMRTRRDNDRFMDLIACVAFLRQYQKDIQESDGMSFISCDMEDYRIAYRIMVDGVLSTTMSELPRGTIEFYEMLRRCVQVKAKEAHVEVCEATFTQRDIREYSGYGQTWVKSQIRILSEYDYILIQQGGAARSKGIYRLREDAPIQDINISMIPTPEHMKTRLAG